MKQNKETIKRDALLLYYKRCRLRNALINRWWQLDKQRTELYKLVEYAKIQYQYTQGVVCAKIMGRHLRELEDAEKRTLRLMSKYDLWAARLEYWVNLTESSMGRLHPESYQQSYQQSYSQH